LICVIRLIRDNLWFLFLFIRVLNRGFGFYLFEC